MTHVSVCGIPSGLGCSIDGTKNGPNALRKHQIIEKIHAKVASIEDLGDVVGPEKPLSQTAPHHNAKYLQEITVWNQNLYALVTGILQKKRISLVLGGDHSFAIGSIGAVYHHCRQTNKPLKVLWFDAHTDFNTPETSPTGNVHGMPVKVLTGKGPAPLTNILSPSGFVPESAFNMVGIRSVDPLEQVAIDQSDVSVFTMQQIRKDGIEAVLEKIFHQIEPNTHLHFSFDIDGIDPTLAPGVGTPVPGGLTLEETQKIFSYIKRSGFLGSIDIFELNPDKDEQGKTARLAVEMVASLF